MENSLSLGFSSSATRLNLDGLFDLMFDCKASLNTSACYSTRLKPSYITFGVFDAADISMQSPVADPDLDRQTDRQTCFYLGSYTKKVH